MNRRSGIGFMGTTVLGILLLLLFAGGFVHSRAQQETKKLWITITPGATAQDLPSVDIAKHHISKKRAEEACWGLAQGTHFLVNFTGATPFRGKRVFTDRDPCSGLPDVDGDGKTEYKYSVSVDGGKTLDPGVIIDP